jgi:hypothetical protein
VEGRRATSSSDNLAYPASVLPRGFVVQRDRALVAVLGPVPVAALPEALSPYARGETTLGVEYHHLAG